MKKTLSILVPTCLSLSTLAFAGPQNIGGFEEMRTACKNPPKFHKQIAPARLEVACRDVQLKWYPNNGTSKSLDTSRDISVRVQSDKYVTSEERAMLPTNPQTVECPAFKQVRETVEVVRPVTCDQL